MDTSSLPTGREPANRMQMAGAAPMKRFTIDVSEELHKRIKAECAQRGEKMADVIRRIFEREFPTPR